MSAVLARRDLHLLYPARHARDYGLRLAVRALIRRAIAAIRAAS